MATKGYKRRHERRDMRQNRREKRRDQRAKDREARKKGPEQQYYGGSKEEFEALKARNKADYEKSKADEESELKELRAERDHTRANEAQAERERQTLFGQGQKSRSDYAAGINSLRDDAESTISKRAAELAGKPTIGQATNAAIQANEALARDRLAQQTGMMNRQARGLAGSMGEGGALAMQQAMASAGAGAADLAAMNQTTQGKLAADMRYDAALKQNQQDIDTANLGMGTRLSAIEAQNAGRLGLMGADQQMTGLSSQRQLGLLGARNNLAGGLYGVQAGKLGDAKAEEMFMHNTQLSQDVEEANKAYDILMKNNKGQRMISTIFDPLDFRGSGSKGYASEGGPFA